MTRSAPGGAAPSLMEQSISGTVEAGAVPGCLLLRNPTGTYQLFGGDPAIVYAGASVTVTGHPATGVMASCAPAKPFQITHASRR